jgi:osmotically inducible protein OsmC
MTTPSTPKPAVSVATTVWSGSLAGGRGLVNLDSSDTARLPVTWPARAEGTSPAAQSTTPEELLAAAHASCYSMALTHMLGEAGGSAESITTTARVGFVAGVGITGVDLHVKVQVPTLPKQPETLIDIARSAKDNCPVSLALRVPITLTVDQR